MKHNTLRKFVLPVIVCLVLNACEKYAGIDSVVESFGVDSKTTWYHRASENLPQICGILGIIAAACAVIWGLYILFCMFRNDNLSDLEEWDAEDIVTTKFSLFLLINCAVSIILMLIAMLIF